MDFFKLRLWIFLIIVIGCSSSKKDVHDQATFEQAICSQLIKTTNNESVCAPSKASDNSIKINLSRLDDSISTDELSDVQVSESLPKDHILEVDLSHNKHLTKIPPFVFQLPQLQSLNISHTSIKGWGEEMCQLENLKSLRGSHNKYQGREIPFHTFCLKNLETLDMSHSNVAYIDEYIGELKSLKELHLQNNQLTLVPLMIETIPHLSLVDFSNNKFADEDISDLHSCVGLDEDDKEDCREDFLDTMSCTFHYDIPFERGESFRKLYTDLSGQNLDEFQSDNKGIAPVKLDQDPCYMFWVGFLVNHNDPEILKKTIKGRTLRELKYQSDYQYDSISYWEAPWCYSVFPRPVVGAQSFEIRPEEVTKILPSQRIFSVFRGDYYFIPSTKDTSEGLAKCSHLDGMKLEETVKEQLKYWELLEWLNIELY